RRAGWASRAPLLQQVAPRTGDPYRVELHPPRPDPRAGARGTPPGAPPRPPVGRPGPGASGEPPAGPRKPRARAPDPPAGIGMETHPFKLRVRRLKELGLTESLRIGYRLSPRGRAFLKHEGPGNLPGPLK